MTQSGQPGAPPPPGQPPGSGAPPPSSGSPPGAPPPPQWQSTPQQPAPPPSGGTPSWTANLTSQAPVPGPAGYYYADVPNRIIAYIIDAIILFIIFIIINIVLTAVFGPTTRIVPDPANPTNPFAFRVETNFLAAIISALVNLAVSGAYFIYTWINMRGTPGMKVLGMQVGNETDGRTITMNQAITRFILLGAPFGLAQALTGISDLSLIISLVAFVYFIALLVTTAQSPTKQGLHDRYAHTVVVKAARAVG